MESFFSHPRSDLELLSIATKTSYGEFGEGSYIFRDTVRAHAFRQLLAANRSKSELWLLLGVVGSSDMREEIAHRLLAFPFTKKEKREVDLILRMNTADDVEVALPDLSDDLYERMVSIKHLWAEAMEKKEEKQQNEP